MVLRIAALALFTFAPPALAQHEVPDDEVYSPRVSGASEEGQQAITGTIVSAGFRVELFAAEPHLANPVVFAIDPKLRFFVAETFRLHAGVTDMRSHMNWLHDELACRTVEDRVAMMRKHEGARFDERYAVEHERIKLVWDEDGDGVADTSTVYADGFANPADGIAAGVLPLGEDVYYACIPDLWVLRDEDGDGVADRRKSLHTGWGVHIALLGHDMHGLMRGPDGRLYWSIGDRGFHVEHEGKTFAHPHAGAVLRSELDGSNLEVFATGLRNPQELCFDDHGNLWTGDNNSDGGDRARWTYVLEGAEIGWRHAFQYVGFPNSRGPWNAEKVWHPPHAGQPAYTVPPVANFSDGPSGLAYYPGTGFGPDWRGHFFLCDFRGGPSNSGVHAFRVEAKGAGFELVDPKRFVWNCLPTDVDFGPDGNLYYSDWVNGWGMTGKGRIYRVTTDEYADERTELRQIFADGMQGREAAQLRRLLGHGNQRVRLEAQWELAERGEHALLLEAATDPQANALARLHGLWGLGHLLRVDGREAARVVRELLSLHDDPDLEVRAQLYKLLGDLRWLDAVPLALRALEDDSARVRSFAAQALGQMGDARAFGPLVDLLASNDDQDPWLRHAAVWALVSLGDGDRIAGLSQHEHPAVRRGAVVALRRLAHPGLARFVADADRSVVAEAARAIYDAPVPEAMTDLAMLLPSITPGDEHYLARRALLANRYLGGEPSAERIGRWLVLGGHPQANREAMEILRDWDVLAGPDPMTGEWRPVGERALAEARRGVIAVANAGVWQQFDEAGQRAYVITLEKHHELGQHKELTKLAVDHGRPWQVRAEALRAVLRSQKLEQADVLAAAFSDPDGRVRAIAYGELGKRAPERAVELLLKSIAQGSVEERGSAILALGRIDHDAARKSLSGLATAAANLPYRATMLEVREALELQGMNADEQLAVTVLEELGDGEYSQKVMGHVEALAGGDVAAGRRIFLEKTETNCLRCHSYADKGGSEVGPDLSKVGERLTREELLLSVLDPNDSVAEEFENWLFGVDDGTVVTGRIRSETADLVVVETPQKETVELHPDEITVRKRDASSMPQDLATHLSPRELRDLIAFLAAQR